jgi:hypothetical protein
VLDRVRLQVLGPESEIGRAPTPLPLSGSTVLLVLLVVAELVAAVAVVAIWREKGGSRAAKTVWSIVTLVPLFGLLAFLVWRDPPPPNDPMDRPPKHDWDG